jgi:homoserine kinase type II
VSVFTPVSPAEADALLARYTLGARESLEGIAQGVENTNYFLETTTGHYVLTLFEHIPRADLPFYVGLMNHLAEADVRCPKPMRLNEGGMIAEVNGKPACIVTKLPGAPRMKPTAEDCHGAGAVLADIHVAGVEYDAGLANWRGREWRESFAEKLRPRISRGEFDLIDAENRYQAMHDDTVLPQGIIHGDYFQDNVLWDDEGAAGVIDFYFACDDALAYDIAIAVNDWCVRPDATVDEERARAFLDGYETHRPLTDFERGLWPVMLRRAALRTWLGRLGYNHFPRASEMTIPKDHAFSRRLLENHIANAHGLAALVA